VNLGVLFVVFIIAVLGLYVYEQVKKKGQLLCIFRTPSKTREEKFVKLQSKYVVYRGGKYKVDPEKIQLTWWNRGLWGLLGVGFWVPTLDFTWWTDQPYDPNNFEVTWDTPEVRNMLGSETDYLEFAKGANPQGAKKESAFQRFVPWIALIVAIIAVFVVWQLRGDIANLYQLMQVK
jgi:hypothetical protein